MARKDSKTKFDEIPIGGKFKFMNISYVKIENTYGDNCRENKENGKSYFCESRLVEVCD